MNSAVTLLRTDDPPTEAAAIVDEVVAVVAVNWLRTLKAYGVSEHDAQTLKGTFLYPGFQLLPDSEA
jgi:hypothetical protein